MVNTKMRPKHCMNSWGQHGPAAQFLLALSHQNRLYKLVLTRGSATRNKKLLVALGMTSRSKKLLVTTLHRLTLAI